MSFFNQDQGMQEILPQAYIQCSEDKIMSLMPKLVEKANVQGALYLKFVVAG
jgi:hypothetical protein